VVFKLIDLQKVRREEIVAAVEALLKAAKAGDIEGLAFVVKLDREAPRVGTAGIYRRQPEKALQAVFAMEKALCSSVPFASSQ
jgi:hypothetical protein